ncbi:hypothetical protein [Maricaulis sp. MIT060901]|uniref:hypothetical protein n=1 Tax=Maricaulis sp. MIT060901 TaxID=3096993 RepID=UPI00399BF996
MKRSKMVILLCSSAVMISGAIAEAQRGPRGGQGQDGMRGGGPARTIMLLRASDANGDNTITREEVAELQSEMFDWMDRNADGYLDDSDMSPMNRRLREMREREGSEGRERPRRRGRRADTNEDGRVSREEFMNVEHRWFERLDSDENGSITPEELDAAAERRENRRFWWRD